MNSISRPTLWLVSGGLGLVIFGVSLQFWLGKGPRSDSPPEAAIPAGMPGDGGKLLPVISRLESFTLTNHHGQLVNLESLRGKVWVADVIFTRCAGPCLQMTQRMKELVEATQREGKVEFVSFTTDPEFDTPEVLRKYAERTGAEKPHWRFFTGTKAELVRVMVGGLKLTALEKKPEERSDPADLFIHSTLFVIVDGQGRLRKAVEGLEPDFKAKVMDAVGRLSRE